MNMGYPTYEIKYPGFPGPKKAKKLGIGYCWGPGWPPGWPLAKLSLRAPKM